jgi:uncharacterized protein involved in response to NO
LALTPIKADRRDLLVMSGKTKGAALNNLHVAVPQGASIPILRAGFRPFFLLAGLQAATILPAWLGQMLAGLDLKLPYSPALWHGHEMVFGFAGAAVAGFLLTAVPSWTGMATVKGPRLAALALLWLAARLAFWGGAVVPPAVAGALDLAFLPALAAVVAPPLWRAGKLRNIAFLPILSLMTLADALVVAEMVGWAETGWSGLLLGIFLFLMMIAIIGGRIIPTFTANGLKMIGVNAQLASRPWLDRLAIGGLAATAVAELVWPATPLAGGLALATAVLHFARLAGWGGLPTMRVPLLWVLHLGYLWLPIGLALLGLASFVPAITPQLAVHALTVGCIGMMVLGVTTRASLGHSGRPLRPARPTVVAYGLVCLAAVVRVFGVMVDAEAGLWVSGLLWTAAFLLYLYVYMPIFLRPRVDGGPG